MCGGGVSASDADPKEGKRAEDEKVVAIGKELSAGVWEWG